VIFFPLNIDGRILQDANDRSNIVGDFFYNFVGNLEMSARAFFLTTVGVICLFGAPCLLANDCNQAQSGSGEWTNCTSMNDYDEADVLLNASYKEFLRVLREMKHSKDASALVASQRSWLKYRNEYCGFVLSLCGTGDYMCLSEENYCKARLTRERTRELEYVLEPYR
jgi:uncharacterized protein YecT (DUF1311 family)